MFPFQADEEEESPVQRLSWSEQLIADLRLQEHPEGGYFIETDRSQISIHNPFNSKHADLLDNMRPTSTSIYYLLNRTRPNGFFHRNQSRTIHTLHEGSGIYLLLHPPNSDAKTAHIQQIYMTRRGRSQLADFGGYERRRLDNGWTIEKFGVGRQYGVYQWLVEGNVYKASFLLDFDSSFGYIEPEKKQLEIERRDGLFITEVVSPGFDFSDHNFMGKAEYNEIFLTKELKAEFRTLLRP